MRIHFDNPQRALLIIDSARILGNIGDDEAAFFTAKIYTQSSFQRLDTALTICESLMNSPFVEVDDNNRELVLDLLVSITRLLHHNEEYIFWASEKVALCRNNGNQTEMLRTLAEIGLVLVYLGEIDDGLSKINGVIASLDGRHGWAEVDACVIALKRKINALYFLERYVETIPPAQHMISILNDCRLHPQNYVNNSNRIGNDLDEVQDYCDFYTFQAHTFLANAFALSNILDSARFYLDLVEQSPLSSTLNARIEISPTWRQLGMFDKMLATYDEASLVMGNDTLNKSYASMLFGRAIAAETRGQYHLAGHFYRRFATLTNLLNRQTQQGQAHEYAARYHLHEERLKAENERLKARKNHFIAISLSVLVLLSLCCIVYLLLQRRRMSHKNHALVEQINETLRYKQQYETINSSSRPSDLNALDDNQLFLFLSDAIRSEHLFLKPDCGRQTLIDHFHISDRRIGAAFAHGGKNSSLPDFVRDCRLEYACQLLSSHPEMSIGEVAIASGFSSQTVFGRDFKRKYQVTPTSYRSHLSNSV